MNARLSFNQKMEKCLKNRNKIINDRDSMFNINRFIFNPLTMPLWDDKFLYKEIYHNEFNSNNFRCDEFIKNHNGKHILFMGCSETQGCNDGLDDTWSYILYKKISSLEKTSGYFNIALCGSSIFLQISIFLNYIEKFGIPDEIYFLTPGTDRNLIFVNDKIDHRSFFSEEYETTEKLTNSFISSIMYLKMFESICKILNIKMIWSTWSSFEEDFFSRFPFMNFFSLELKNIHNEIPKYVMKHFDENDSMNNNLFKSDKGHRGKAFHKGWAEIFYDKIYNK